MERSRHLRSFGYLLLSLFLIWHVVGITIVGPFSQSYLRDGFMKMYQGYLGVFHLNRSWPFYAPNPSRGSILKYQTVSRSGETKTYPLTQGREKFDHAYFRYTNFYAYLFYEPGYSENRGYDKSVARLLCSRHLEDIVQINFILLSQKKFTRNDYLEGKRPLDNEFLKEQVFGPYDCQLDQEASS